MNSPATTAKLRWLYLPWAIATVVFLAYLLLWRAGAAEMKKAVVNWVQDQRAAGAEISYGALKTDGFPFFLRVHIEQPDIAYADQFYWRTDLLTIDALPYDLNRLIFSAHSDQHLHFGRQGEWRIKTNDFRISIANDKQREWAFAMTVAGATAVRSDGVKASLEKLVLDASPTASDKTIFTMSLEARGASVTDQTRKFDLDTVQTVMAASQTPFLNNIQEWRDAGGMLLINGFIANSGDASLSVSGELAPDHQLYPAGTLHTEVKSPATFVQLLAEAGAIDKEDVESISSTLTLAAIANGGKLAAPIILKEGVVQVAGVTIAELGSID
ncbi:DUF2125 domain-containing protein [Hyphococcus sp.]|uniref:DUF2125 domain-containing protein n=1 Tax=Hyphococcus sp. TaxID=2038636 RepID=UPI002085AC20|nr:MAG: hypothetical protein DHS20C04_00840 [Marinicaulis sp.]